MGEEIDVQLQILKAEGEQFSTLLNEVRFFFLFFFFWSSRTDLLFLFL